MEEDNQRKIFLYLPVSAVDRKRASDRSLSSSPGELPDNLACNGNSDSGKKRVSTVFSMRRTFLFKSMTH
jgi:hypothetical protein